jgi:hypothetical protein
MSTRIEHFSATSSFSIPVKMLWPLIALVAIICGFVGVDSYVRFAGYGLTPLWFSLVVAIGFAVVAAHRIDRKTGGRK